MAFFNGQPIFGIGVSIIPGSPEREYQRNAFMGVDGVEELDGGFRTMTTVARGTLVGWNSGGGLADLQAAMITFRSYVDGMSYTLVDTAGLVWRNVKLESFNLDTELGLIRTSMNDWLWSYTATFTHLSRE